MAGEFNRVEANRTGDYAALRRAEEFGERIAQSDLLRTSSKKAGRIIPDLLDFRIRFPLPLRFYSRLHPFDVVTSESDDVLELLRSIRMLSSSLDHGQIEELCGSRASYSSTATGRSRGSSAWRRRGWRAPCLPRRKERRRPRPCGVYSRGCIPSPSRIDPVSSGGGRGGASSPSRPGG